jgi:hypothetical protein
VGYQHYYINKIPLPLLRHAEIKPSYILLVYVIVSTPVPVSIINKSY